MITKLTRYILSIALLTGCVQHVNRYKKSVVGNWQAVKFTNKVVMQTFIPDACLDELCAYEGGVCQTEAPEQTARTIDGREFTPFSSDIMDFLYKSQASKVVSSVGENGIPDDVADVDEDAKFNLNDLQQILKINMNNQNFTSINERITITPQFIVMTRTKQKLMMKMTIGF